MKNDIPKKNVKTGLFKYELNVVNGHSINKWFKKHYPSNAKNEINKHI
jgi:hypothetical protein